MQEPIEHTLRVRYAETDQMGVVYYANYLVWFEVARTELCKARGFSYAEMERQTDSRLIVTESVCRYRAPARYDDLIRLRCWIAELRTRALTFAYEVANAESGALLAEGHTKHVVMDAAGKLKRFPDEHYRMLAGHGSGTGPAPSE